MTSVEAGEYPPINPALRVPPMVTFPLTTSLSDCDSPFPPRSTARVPVDPRSRLPVMDKVPAVPFPPGEMVPLLINVAEPTSMVPVPARVPSFVKPLVSLKVVPVARVTVPDWVSPPVAANNPALTVTVPVLPMFRGTPMLLVPVPELFSTVPALVRITVPPFGSRL